MNEALFESADKANKYANILMPIMINIGNIQYVIVAVVGGVLALNGLGGGITLGTIASFLQLSKSFTNPISQISQQLNIGDYGPGGRPADFCPDGRGARGGSRHGHSGQRRLRQAGQSH